MRWLRNIFYHNRNERRGYFVLLVILFLGILSSYLYLNHYQPPADEYADLLKDVEFVEDIPRKQYQRKNKYSSSKREYQSNTKWRSKSESISQTPKRPIEEFPFDPNTISVDSLVLLGIPKRTAQVLDNYRKKGGRFYSKEKVMDIYGMERHYGKIQHLIDIPREAKRPKTENKSRDTSAYSKDSLQKTILLKPKYKKFEPKVVDINRADTIGLRALRGVGPFYAKTIYQLRERLGGFYMAEQLIDAYGTPDTILTTIGREWIKIDTDAIRKININNTDFVELVKHPYINKNQANAILKYRERHGDYPSVESIKKIVLIKEEDYDRLKYYLRVE